MSRQTFNPPKTVIEYGYENNLPIIQEGSASGFLLGWDALDAHRTALAERRPCEYLVVGEDTNRDGRPYPVLGMNPEYMRWTGHIVERTRSGRITGWHLARPKEEAADRAQD